MFASGARLVVAHGPGQESRILIKNVIQSLIRAIPGIVNVLMER